MSRTAIAILVLMAVACAAVVIVVWGLASADKHQQPAANAFGHRNDPGCLRGKLRLADLLHTRVTHQGRVA